MTSIKEKFDNAVNEINHATWGNEIPNDRKLKCYGYFKQATIGDINTPQPWYYQMAARAKWDAWSILKGISKEKAMSLYVTEWEQQKKDFSYLRKKHIITQG